MINREYRCYGSKGLGKPQQILTLATEDYELGKKVELRAFHASLLNFVGF